MVTFSGAEPFWASTEFFIHFEWPVACHNTTGLHTHLRTSWIVLPTSGPQERKTHYGNPQSLLLKVGLGACSLDDKVLFLSFGSVLFLVSFCFAYYSSRWSHTRAPIEKKGSYSQAKIKRAAFERGWQIVACCLSNVCCHCLLLLALLLRLLLMLLTYLLPSRTQW